MFFRNKESESEVDFIVDEALLKTRVDPYAKLKEFYFKEIDGQKLILNVSNKLKQSNAMIQFDDGTIWQAKYIGVVFEFLNATIQQIKSSPHLSSSMQNWVDGHLPVNLNPQIEIGPQKIVDYVVQTIKKYPTSEYDIYLEQIENFKIRFNTCELVENLSAH